MADVPLFQRNVTISETVIDDEIFLVEPASQEVFYLDQVTSALWRLLAEPRSAADLAALFAAAFPAESEDAIARDIVRVTAELLSRGLIVVIGHDATSR